LARCGRADDISKPDAKIKKAGELPLRCTII
jgi:hypothetical protein